MPNKHRATVLPGPSTRDTEGEKHRRIFIPKAEAQSKAWLPWKSHGREHGLKAHRVNSDGFIKEIEERQVTPRRKPKSISSHQWERRY